MASKEDERLIVELANRALGRLDQAGRIALAERILRTHAEVDPAFGTYMLRTGIKQLND